MSNPAFLSVAQLSRRIAAVFLVCLLAACVSAGPPGGLKPLPGTEASVKGDADSIFNEDVLHRVDIRVEPAVYSRVLSDHVRYSAEPSAYRLAPSFSIDGIEIPNVGMRGRGNSFSEDNKRSFKIKFDCVDPLASTEGAAVGERMDLSSYKGRRFMGLEALNLRASNNDPTGVRDILAYRLFREAGVPAPRCSAAMLYLNGECLGLYLITEDPDNQLLKKWFDDDSGDLYKCGWDGSAGATFEPSSFSKKRYDKKEGKDKVDHASLMAFLKALGDVRSGADLEALVDKENVIAYNAICSLTGHWDSLNGNANNDYVYLDPKDGKWHVVVWDPDNSFGSDWIPTVDCRTAPLDSTAREQAVMALFCRLASRHWAAETRELMRRIVAEQGNGAAFAERVHALRDLVKEEVKAKDPYLRNYEAFLQAFDGKPAFEPFQGGNIQQYRPGIGLTKFFSDRLSHIAWLLSKEP